MIKKKNNTSYSFARIFFSGILFCGISLQFACKNTNEEIENITGISKAHQLDKAKDVTIYYSDKGQLKAVVYAKEFIRNEAAKPSYADINKGLKVEFYNDSLKVESTFPSSS